MSIVWRDKVLSSYNGNIESVVVTDAGGDYPNGLFVTLQGPLEGHREVKEAKLTTADATDALLIASPEVFYENGKEIDDFMNEEGGVARAFRLADGDTFTLTEDLLPEGDASGISVGDDYYLDAGGKLTANAEDATGIKFRVRELAGFELTSKQKAVRFDVVK